MIISYIFFLQIYWKRRSLFVYAVVSVYVCVCVYVCIDVVKSIVYSTSLSIEKSDV